MFMFSELLVVVFDKNCCCVARYQSFLCIWLVDGSGIVIKNIYKTFMHVIWVTFYDDVLKIKEAIGVADGG